jgi:hypothetical protein
MRWSVCVGLWDAVEMRPRIGCPGMDMQCSVDSSKGLECDQDKENRSLVVSRSGFEIDDAGSRRDRDWRTLGALETVSETPLWSGCIRQVVAATLGDLHLSPAIRATRQRWAASVWPPLSPGCSCRQPSPEGAVRWRNAMPMCWAVGFYCMRQGRMTGVFFFFLSFAPRDRLSLTAACLRMTSTKNSNWPPPRVDPAPLVISQPDSHHLSIKSI